MVEKGKIYWNLSFVKDSVRTLSSVWKHYPNDTAVGRQTYTAVWIQPNFFSHVYVFPETFPHMLSLVEWNCGSLLVHKMCLSETPVPRFDLWTEFICLFFYYYFLFTSAFCFHTDLVQATDIFNPPPGVDAWCIWCTLSLSFHSRRTVKYTCKQRWRTVLKRLCLKCYFSSYCVALAEGDEESSLPTTANLWRRITKASLDTCSVDTAAHRSSG